MTTGRRGSDAAVTGVRGGLAGGQEESLIPWRQLRAGDGQYGGRAAELPAHGMTGGGANRENLP
ncbi:hypothetical protein GCM10010336_05800 [Streptomyces goshikiensis]|nr:hypothetical protein GCM10010336_05800 [Streptomyces goshikiensis]